MVKKRIQFYDGLIYVDNIQCVMFPMNSFLAIIHKIFEFETKKKTREIFHSSSLIDSLILKNNFSIVQNNKRKLLECLLILEECGFGSFSLLSFSKKIIITQKNQFYLNYIKKDLVLFQK